MLSKIKSMTLIGLEGYLVSVLTQIQYNWKNNLLVLELKIYK